MPSKAVDPDRAQALRRCPGACAAPMNLAGRHLPRTPFKALATIAPAEMAIHAHRRLRRLCHRATRQAGRGEEPVFPVALTTPQEALNNKPTQTAHRHTSPAITFLMTTDGEP